jgi:hypothetical protein
VATAPDIQSFVECSPVFLCWSAGSSSSEASGRLRVNSKHRLHQCLLVPLYCTQVVVLAAVKPVGGRGGPQQEGRRRRRAVVMQIGSQGHVSSAWKTR